MSYHVVQSLGGNVQGNNYYSVIIINKLNNKPQGKLTGFTYVLRLNKEKMTRAEFEP